MQFYCYRIHLHSGVVTGELNLGDESVPQTISTKEDYIRYLSTHRIGCREVGSEYVYDYEYQEDNYIGGVFGKPRLETFNDGPESHWQTSEIPTWYPYCDQIFFTTAQIINAVRNKVFENTTKKALIDFILYI